MNIIKKVTVFVMGVVVIGVVATTVGIAIQTTKTVEKSVTFELLDNDLLAYDVYSKIKEYAIFNEETYFTDNLVNIFINGDSSEYKEPYIEYYGTDIINISDNVDEEPSISIYDNNTYSVVSYGFNLNDIITITFVVEVGPPVIIKTLLFLTPLILSASLIGFLSLSVKKGDE